MTTSGIGKFYSNGLDLEHAESTEGYWAGSLYRVFGRLLTCVYLSSSKAFSGMELCFYMEKLVFGEGMKC